MPLPSPFFHCRCPCRWIRDALGDPASKNVSRVVYVHPGLLTTYRLRGLDVFGSSPQTTETIFLSKLSELPEQTNNELDLVRLRECRQRPNAECDKEEERK